MNYSEKRCNKYCLVPQRYLIAIMMSFGIILDYPLRDAIGIVLKYIIKASNQVESSSNAENWCNFTSKHQFQQIKVDEQYDWHLATARANVKHSFFYGYLIGHIPGGYLADKYGGKHVFGLSVLIPAVLVLLIPVLITQTKTYTAILVVQFLIGLVEGAVFPAANSLLTNWTPQKERGGLSEIVFVSSQMGTVVNNLCTPELLKRYKWTHIFYIYSGMAMVWWIFWMLFCYSNPYTNPFIRDKEFKYLTRELHGHIVFKQKTFPWKQLLSSCVVWVLMIVQLGHTWIWHSLISDLPQYMTDILKYDMKASHLVASLPYGIMSCLTLFLGFVTDCLINRQYITQNAIRKSFTTVGAMSPGIFVLAAAFSGCNRKASLYMFSLAMALMSFYYPGTRIITLDLAPNYSGIIMGMANGLGAVPGLVQQKLTKALTKNASHYEWRKLFLIFLLVLALTNVIFVLFGTSQEQPWNNNTRRKSRKTKTDEKTS